MSLNVTYRSNVNTSAPDGYTWSDMAEYSSFGNYVEIVDIFSEWVDTVHSHWGDNYSFKEWNTARDGSGTTYNAGDKVYESITLYPIWNGETLSPITMEIAKGTTRYYFNVLTAFERNKISNALTQSSVREYDVVDFSDWPEWESGNSYEVGDRVKYTYTIVHTFVKGWICIVANSSDTLETTEWEQVTRFPTPGEKDVLYIAKLENKAYYWDVDEEEYVCISGDAEGKADKVVNATSGNFAALDSNGNLIDSGHKHSDYLTEHQDVSGKLNVSEKGAANGVAELDANGLVPSSQLPSYVDDVLEFDDKDATHYAAWVSGTSYAVGDKVGYTDSTGNEPVTTYYICTTANSDVTFDESNWREAELFPTTGESGKIYVDVTTNITYRWGGSVYVAIGSDLALGETSSTAYRGDRGKAAYDAAVVNVDSTPTTNSTHLITSGGVKAALPGTMTGATSSAAGTSGLVPQPSAGDEGKVLKGNGTWDNVDALPTVTSSDNNKVLEVVDGEWATGSKKIDKEYESSGYTDIWGAKTWSGLTSFAGQYVWSDGDNIYYSNSSNQYVLNKSTSTWSAKSWTGLAGFYGYNIWSDGDNIYHSNSSTQYVLNKSTSTWSTKSWTGLTIFSGKNVWTDGDNIYYSSSSKQYVLDKSTSTWSAKTWTGLTSFDGGYVWSDGDNIYYSYNTDQYVLNKSTSTWSTKSWTGLTNFNGNLIWKAGNNIYYSNSSTQRVLDKSTSTLSAKTWTGLTNFNGSDIWSDGDNIYYSNSSTQYLLYKDNSPKLLFGTNGEFSPVNASEVLPSDMTGASSSAAGTHGLVPAPAQGDQDKFLKGDGTWGEVNASSSTVRKVSFTIATTDWTQSSNTYVADVTDSHITSTTEELIMYTNSVKNLTSDIDTNKDGTNNKITFIVDSVPTGAISGSIYIISQGNIVADTKVDIDQGVENAGKFLVVNSQGNVEPVTMQAWQGGSY